VDQLYSIVIFQPTSLKPLASLQQAHLLFVKPFALSQEYRAIVCGRVKEAGVQFTIDEPLDGKPSRTDVKVLEAHRTWDSCVGVG